MTDQILFQRWIEHRDPEVFKDLTSRYAAMLFATCKRILRNAAEAEDVTQECFEKLAIAQDPPKEHFAGWLHRMATNRSLNRLRERNRRRLREAAFAADHSASKQIEWNDLYDYVDEAIEELPERIRIPIVAHFLQSDSHSEIAKTLGISRRAVSHRIAKGIDLITKSLKRRGVKVGAGALAVMMGHNLIADAAPSSLVATLGKLALSRVGSPVTLGTATKSAALSQALLIGGVDILSRKALVGLGVIVLAAVLLPFVIHKPTKDLPAQVPSPKFSSAITSNGPQEGPARVASSQNTQATESAIAKEEPTARQTAAAQSMTFSGVVVDEYSRAFPNALVVLSVSSRAILNPRIYWVVTGQDGRFEITGVDAPRESDYVLISAHARGYVCLPNEGGTNLSISSESPPHDLIIALRSASSSLNGRVVSETGDPVPGARVSIMSGPRYVVTSYGVGSTVAITGEDGRFEVAVSDEGVYVLIVAKEGYALGFFPEISTNDKNGDFILRSPGAIEGCVTWRDGGLAQGVLVELLGKPPGDVPDMTAPELRSTLTDEQGRFLLADLSQDLVYTVAACHPNPDKVWSSENEEWRDEVNRSNTMWTKKSSSESVKVGIAVPAGQTVRDVNLILDAASSIFGHVTDAQEGRSMPSIHVSACADRDCYSAVTDADGAYTIPIEVDSPNDFKISYMYMIAGSWFVGGELDDVHIALAPGKNKQFDFTLPGYVTVPVRFTDAKGAPLQHVQAWLAQAGSKCGIGELDDEGRVTVDKFPPDRTFKIEVGEAGHILGLTAPIVGSPGQTLDEIRVVCPLQGGISGVLLDPEGIPVANTMLSCAVSQSECPACPRQRAKSNDNGEFTISPALPEGFYSQVYIFYVAGMAQNPDPAERQRAATRTMGFFKTGEARVPDAPEESDDVFIVDYRLAMLTDVQIVRDEITSVGDVVVQPVSKEQAAQYLGGTP